MSAHSSVCQRPRSDPYVAANARARSFVGFRFRRLFIQQHIGLSIPPPLNILFALWDMGRVLVLRSCARRSLGGSRASVLPDEDDEDSSHSDGSVRQPCDRTRTPR